MKNLLTGIKTTFLNAVQWFMGLPKKTQGISVGILACLLLVIIVFSGGANKKFVGTWEEIDSQGKRVYNGEMLILANDGTGSAESEGMTASVKWSVEGDKLFVSYTMCGTTETYEYDYEFSGNTLTLTYKDGEKTIFRKK